jgi:hypothetical protein
MIHRDRDGGLALRAAAGDGWSNAKGRVVRWYTWSEGVPFDAEVIAVE